MNNAVKHHLQGEELVLLPDRAVFWPLQNALLISDPHFGKASSFRNAGIPVPVGTTPADLRRLNGLLEVTKATRLIVLGDFFHHRSGQCDRTMALLSEWRRTFSDLTITIILGNHDRHSHLPPPEWDVEIHDKPLPFAPFLLCHEPCQHEGLYVLSGHIHPGIRLRDPGGHYLTLPCFYFGADFGILPAFGSFTGMMQVTRNNGDAVFGIADDEVIPMSRAVSTSPLKR